jgi:hypothetical protein
MIISMMHDDDLIIRIFNPDGVALFLRAFLVGKTEQTCITIIIMAA